MAKFQIELKIFDLLYYTELTFSEAWHRKLYEFDSDEITRILVVTFRYRRNLTVELPRNGKLVTLTFKETYPRFEELLQTCASKVSYSNFAAEMQRRIRFYLPNATILNVILSLLLTIKLFEKPTLAYLHNGPCQGECAQSVFPILDNVVLITFSLAFMIISPILFYFWRRKKTAAWSDLCQLRTETFLFLIVISYLACVFGNGIFNVREKAVVVYNSWRTGILPQKNLSSPIPIDKHTDGSSR